MKEWSYFDKFEAITDKYMPSRGEGYTMASQIVTAVNKLIYKWYNDGDVFDNTYNLGGWCNDLSSYANWLDKYTDADEVLLYLRRCKNGDDYTDLLGALADKCLNEEYLFPYIRPAEGTIYECDGIWEYGEPYDEDEEDYEEEDEEEE